MFLIYLLKQLSVLIGYENMQENIPPNSVLKHMVMEIAQCTDLLSLICFRKVAELLFTPPLERCYQHLAIIHFLFYSLRNKTN